MDKYHDEFYKLFIIRNADDHSIDKLLRNLRGV